MTTPGIYVGLDLGQAQDPTALAIAVVDPPVEGDTTPAPVRIRHLERYPLGTKYGKIVKQVAKLLAAPELGGQARLVVDATGVGRAVTDMLTDAGLAFDAVTITPGAHETHDGDDWRVPKRNLVSVVQVLLQAGRLKIAEDLPLGPILRDELQSFKYTISETTAHDSYNAREGQHDDVLLAVALAAWRAERVDINPLLGYMAFGSAHVAGWHGASSTAGGRLISTNGGGFFPARRRIR